LAGEEVGFKSSWHVELNFVWTEAWIGSCCVDDWEFEATLVFDEYLGNEESWDPFRCHAKISMIEPETSRLVTSFKPDLQAVTVEKVDQRIVFKHGGGAMYEKKNNIDVVKSTICLSVELEVFGEKYSYQNDFPEDFGSKHLVEDFENLLNCNESSDFTIKCDGKDFSVHKSILWGRSKVFARMLNNPGFKEYRENIMVVEDITQGTMEILLHYIYTGKLSKLLNSNKLEGVIRGADKYELTELKEYCFLKLVRSITVENFGSLAYVVTSCQAGEKVLAVLKGFYERNVLKLMKNAQFRKLAAEHPEVVFEK